MGFTPGLPEPSTRRIGARLPTGDVEARLLIEEHTWRRRKRHVPVVIENASVTGVGMRVPALTRIGLGGVGVLELDGEASAVRLRHRADTSAPEEEYMGFEFIESRPRVLERIYRHMRMSEIEGQVAAESREARR